MSTAKHIENKKQTDENDEPDDWYVSRITKRIPLSADLSRDQRIFSTGCSGMDNESVKIALLTSY